MNVSISIPLCFFIVAIYKFIALLCLGINVHVICTPCLLFLISDGDSEDGNQSESEAHVRFSLWEPTPLCNDTADTAVTSATGVATGAASGGCTVVTVLTNDEESDNSSSTATMGTTVMSMTETGKSEVMSMTETGKSEVVSMAETGKSEVMSMTEIGKSEVVSVAETYKSTHDTSQVLHTQEDVNITPKATEDDEEVVNTENCVDSDTDSDTQAHVEAQTSLPPPRGIAFSGSPINNEVLHNTTATSEAPVVEIEQSPQLDTAMTLESEYSHSSSGKQNTSSSDAVLLSGQESCTTTITTTESLMPSQFQFTSTSDTETATVSITSTATATPPPSPLSESILNNQAPCPASSVTDIYLHHVERTPDRKQHHRLTLKRKASFPSETESPVVESLSPVTVEAEAMIRSTSDHEEEWPTVKIQTSTSTSTSTSISLPPPSKKSKSKKKASTTMISSTPKRCGRSKADPTATATASANSSCSSSGSSGSSSSSSASSSNISSSRPSRRAVTSPQAHRDACFGSWPTRKQAGSKGTWNF